MGKNGMGYGSDVQWLKQLFQGFDYFECLLNNSGVDTNKAKLLVHETKY